MKCVTVPFTHPFEDPKAFVRQIITTACQRVDEQLELLNDKPGGAWLNGLRTAFSEAYKEFVGGDPQQPKLAVFGGRPPADQSKLPNPSEIPNWQRWEFMHDVSVVEVDWVKAAYRDADVPIVRRALWQVESEVRLNGTAVAEDLSKLIVGQADFKLMIVARTKREDATRWADFIRRAAQGISAHAYVAEIPTYAGMPLSHWSKIDRGDIDVRPLHDA